MEVPDPRVRRLGSGRNEERTARERWWTASAARAGGVDLGPTVHAVRRPHRPCRAGGHRCRQQHPDDSCQRGEQDGQRGLEGAADGGGEDGSGTVGRAHLRRQHHPVAADKCGEREMRGHLAAGEDSGEHAETSGSRATPRGHEPTESSAHRDQERQCGRTRQAAVGGGVRADRAATRCRADDAATQAAHGGRRRDHRRSIAGGAALTGSCRWRTHVHRRGATLLTAERPVPGRGVDLRSAHGPPTASIRTDRAGTALA